MPGNPEDFKERFPALYASVFKAACVGSPTQGDVGSPVASMVDIADAMTYFHHIPVRSTSKFATTIGTFQGKSDNGQLMIMLKEVMQNNTELAQRSFRRDADRLQSIQGLATPPLQQGSFPPQLSPMLMLEAGPSAHVTHSALVSVSPPTHAVAEIEVESSAPVSVDPPTHEAEAGTIVSVGSPTHAVAEGEVGACGVRNYSEGALGVGPPTSTAAGE